MISPAVPAHDVVALPDIRIPSWAWVVVAAAAALIYIVTAESGVALGAGANSLHEFFHDGRHLSGIPCH
jgi:Probable cobalt transporter subunit (CbtB)